MIPWHSTASAQVVTSDTVSKQTETQYAINMRIRKKNIFFKPLKLFMYDHSIFMVI
jgi:hypothetical protein